MVPVVQGHRRDESNEGSIFRAISYRKLTDDTEIILFLRCCKNQVRCGTAVRVPVPTRERRATDVVAGTLFNSLCAL